MRKTLNAGSRGAATDALLHWRRPAAIIPRRRAERDLFRHGRCSGGTIAVRAVNRGGRVDFARPVGRLGECDAAAEQAIAARHRIRGIPRVILFRARREISRTSGAMSAADIAGWARGQLD